MLSSSEKIPSALRAGVLVGVEHGHVFLRVDSSPYSKWQWGECCAMDTRFRHVVDSVQEPSDSDLRTFGGAGQ